ncbi:MAG: AraC family transcriptional regulator [Sedimentisphaeraceae bacterium JB056]
MKKIDITKTNEIIVRCNNGGVFHCERDWSWQVNHMSDYDVWLVCGGRGQLKSGRQIWQLAAGDCFFLSPGTSLSACHDPADRLRVVSSHLDFIGFDGKPIQLSSSPDFHCRITDLFFLEKLMRKCVDNFLRGRSREADMWLQTVIVELVNIASQNSGHEGISRYTSAINELCGKIAACPWQDRQISELAAELHVCPDHFSRIFKSVMHISPMDFIINCRIEHAKGLLISSNYPVKSIAEMAGYNSVYYFSKHFKNKTGVSPSSFRASKAGVI